MLAAAWPSLAFPGLALDPCPNHVNGKIPKHHLSSTYNNPNNIAFRLTRLASLPRTTSSTTTTTAWLTGFVRRSEFRTSERFGKRRRPHRVWAVVVDGPPHGGRAAESEQAKSNGPIK